MIIHQKLYKMTTEELENELNVWTGHVEKRLQDDLLGELSQREQDREESRQAAWLSVQK